MLRTTLAALVMLAGSAGLASAQAPLSQNPPTQTIICLDVNGATLPVSCTVPASRLDKREDMCMCRAGQRVAVSICPPGVRAPPENVELMKARRLAVKDGSLIGDLFKGQPMCVEGRNP